MLMLLLRASDSSLTAAVWLIRATSDGSGMLLLLLGREADKVEFSALAAERISGLVSVQQLREVI